MSSLVEIEPIPTELVPAIWKAFAKGMIEKALAYTDGELTIAQVFTSIMEKQRALWVVFKDGQPIASITTRIEVWPSGLKVAVIDMAGGESFKDWDVFSDYISPFYSSMGCAKLEIAGRAGWEKLHTAKGFKRKYIVLRKDLAPCQKVEADSKPQL